MYPGTSFVPAVESDLRSSAVCLDGSEETISDNYWKTALHSLPDICTRLFESSTLKGARPLIVSLPEITFRTSSTGDVEIQTSATLVDTLES